MKTDKFALGAGFISMIGIALLPWKPFGIFFAYWTIVFILVGLFFNLKDRGGYNGKT